MGEIGDVDLGRVHGISLLGGSSSFLINKVYSTLLFATTGKGERSKREHLKKTPVGLWL